MKNSPRMAHVFDSVEDGKPFVAATHARLDNELAKQVAGYLRSAPLVIRTTSMELDVMDLDRGPILRQSTYFDGEWYWSEGLIWYVEKYQLSPGESFVSHCRKLRFKSPQPTRQQIDELLESIGMLTIED